MYCTLRISKKRQLILHHEYIHMTIMQKKKIFFLITNIALKQSILTLYIFYNGLPNLKKNPYKSMVLKCFLQILFSRCLTRMICLYRGQERERKGGGREGGKGERGMPYFLIQTIIGKVNNTSAFFSPILRFIFLFLKNLIILVQRHISLVSMD